MGANGSAYEEDEETIAVLKGVRLSANVINRMRGASESACPQSPPAIPVPSPPAQTTTPLRALSAPGEPRPSSAEPALQSPQPPSVEPAPSPLCVQTTPPLSPPPPSVEPTPSPLCVQTTPPLSPPSVEPAPSPPPSSSVEPAPQSSHPLSVEPAPSSLCVEATPVSPPPPPPSVEPAPSAPPPTSVAPADPPCPFPSVNAAPPLPLSVEPAPLPPLLDEPAASAAAEAVSPTPSPVVSEERLCGTVTQELELQKGPEQHMSPTELEVHHGAEQEKVQKQVGEGFVEDGLEQSNLTDSTAGQDHRLRAHLYAHQLEQRMRDLKKQDELYREQVARLEQRGKRFYSTITDSYQKASREVSDKFRRDQINPVCADLQREILTCYRENAGHTLSCSRIASLYLQCVSEARQSKTRLDG